MRVVTDKKSLVLHVVEKGTWLKSVTTTITKDENRGVAIVNAPPMKKNPVAISEVIL